MPRTLLRITAICLAWVAAVGASSAHGQEAPVVSIPRIMADVQVDGVLDEAVWRDAAVLRGFSQYLPVDGRPAADSTVVLVWYAPTALYVGIRAYEAHGEVRATLADRDKIEGDDFVHLLLDTFDDQRQAYLVGVNPLGVQADGILRDAPRSTTAFGAQGGGAYSIDLSPDFVYDSKGRVTAYGYEIELRVPFKSLRYQALPEQRWGFNVIRRTQHSGYEDTWAPVRRASASFLAQNGRLAGLSDMRRGLVLDVTPEITNRVTGRPGDERWRYDGERLQAGANVRWGITNNLTLNATVNPDFSQVEADVAQVQYDPRVALFFPEKRPFFLDGIEQFGMPNQLVYTRRVADPHAAVKLTGKLADTNVGLLSAVDRGGTVYNLLRVRRDLGGQSTLGMAYTDRVDGDVYNRVVSGDGHLVFGGIYDVTFQGAASMTGHAGSGIGPTVAPLWDLRANRSGQHVGFSYRLKGYHPDFNAASGFLGRVGVAQMTFIPSLTLFGAEGALLERWTGSVTFDGTWDYDRFLDARYPNDAKMHLNSGFGLRGGWQVSASVLIESFKYPPALYREYFIERRDAHGAVVDTVAYSGTDRLSNLDFVAVVGTPRFQQFSGSLFFIYGRDENFFEWAPADILFVTLSADWRPTEKLRVNFRYNHQQYIRPTDRSTVGMRRIPRLKVEYQLARSVFVRFVGQYDAYQQDALRDDSRTGDPILIYDPVTGAYARTTPLARNRLRLDWLFSYRPTPGTVFFLGYGSSLDDEAAFRFDRLGRSSDGFFFKLSYLFRV